MRIRKNAEDVCPYCGFAPGSYQFDPPVLPPLTILNGKYILGKKLGAGGFGITYIAFDKDLEVPQAIKEFFMSSSMYRDSRSSASVTLTIVDNYGKKLYQVNRDRFKKEAQLLAKIGSIPGIVTVHNYFEQNNTAYIVMEYLEGKTLRQYVKSQGGKLHYRKILELIHPVINSLKELHDYQIYHRDISPDNMMVLKNGSMKLFDFGGARVEDISTLSGGQSADEDEDVHKSSSSIGLVKPGYSPPEQYLRRDKPGPWTDEYALAATLYFCITGKVPIESNHRALDDSLLKPSVYVSDLPEYVENAILKGMAVRKLDRYPDLDAFEKALYGITPPPPITRIPPASEPIPSKLALPTPSMPTSPKPVWKWAVGVLAVVGVGAGIFAYQGCHRPDPVRMQELTPTPVQTQELTSKSEPTTPMPVPTATPTLEPMTTPTPEPTATPAPEPTAYAGAAYGDYLVTSSDTADTLSGKVVKFNDIDWYVISDDSTAVNAGTVTLLAKDPIGASEFNSRFNTYNGSKIESYLDNLISEGGPFAGVADAIIGVDLRDVGVTGAKLWLLSIDEIGSSGYNLSTDVKRWTMADEACANTWWWWLRSSGSFIYNAATVFSFDGRVFDYGCSVINTYGVRPALKLDLSSVIFSSESKTFTYLQ